MQWPFSKKQEDAGNVGYEEISEKKTSKLGYILLIFMFIALVWAGEIAFGDLTDLISRPKSPSSCLSMGVQSLGGISIDTKKTRITDEGAGYDYVNDYSYNDDVYNDYDYYNGSSSCSIAGFTENQADAKALFQGSMNKLVELEALQKNIQRLNTTINSLEVSGEKSRKEYNTGLLENIAGQDGVIDDGALQNSLSGNQIELQRSQTTLAGLEKQEASLRAQLAPMATQMKQLYQQAKQQYETALAWYKFKVVGVQLLFILPLFFLALFRYFSLKKKDSPYTIIATAALGALGFLLLQVAGLFLWEIIPKGILERIFIFFREIAILRYVLYYAFIGLVIAIFGGIVYIIQKRVFNSRAVAVRRIKDKKCPGCSFPIDVHFETFCGKCGLQVLDTCTSCQKAKVRYLDHCSHCGAFGGPAKVQSQKLENL